MTPYEASLYAASEELARQDKARKRERDRWKPECVDCNGDGVHNAYFNECKKCYGTGLGEVVVEGIIEAAFAPYRK